MNKEIFNHVLTNKVLTSHNGEGVPPKAGNIYMAEGQEIPPRLPVSSAKPEAPKAPEVGPTGRKIAPEGQKVINEYWGAAAKEGKVTKEKAREAIEKGIPPISGGAEPAEEEEPQFSLQNPGDPQPTPDQLADPNFAQQFQRLQTIIGGLERRLEQFHNQSDIRSVYDELSRAIQNGEVPQAEADRYLNRIARLAREGERVQGVPEWLVEILRMPRGPGRTEALKRVIDPLTPDLTQLPDEFLQALAEDEEAAEKFFDKIVSRPFSTPRSQYETGWYERMNLNSFLEKVRAVDEARFQAIRGEYRERGEPIPIELSPGRDTARYEQFASKRETAIRFHEMNRIVFVESGNLDAFVQMTRTVSPQNITDALTEVGVEEVRQLYDIAFGRLYAKEDRVTTQNVREVQEWVGQKFREWVDSGIVVNSAYNRSLEEWEIRRALAYGRNIGNAFFRNPGIIAMGHIPRQEWQEWIKSFPSETVVRGIAGAKFLLYRFWIGREAGGKEFMEQWFKKLIRVKCDTGEEAHHDGKPLALKKVGKLDIREDIIPATAFDGGGFDKGWRTVWGYLDNDANMLTLPDPNTLPQQLKRGREILQALIEKYGREMTVGKLLSKLEDEAKLMPGIVADVPLGGGVEQKERIVNDRLFREYIEEGLLAVTGSGSIKIGKDTIEVGRDKVHLGLGLLIAQGTVSEKVKVRLWEKASEYLPLRIAYIFSETERDNKGEITRRGVRDIDGYEDVKGTNGNLFSDDFETKLLLLQRKRIQQQEEVGEEPVPLDLSSLSGPEQLFVAELTKLGKEYAPELAKIPWSDVPFLDDVPVGMVEADKFGDEAFPRRMGGDLSSFFQTNGELIGLITNLNQPYKEVLGHLRKVAVEFLPTPHDLPTGQNMVLPIFKTYLEFRRTNGLFWRYTPFAKDLAGVFRHPTSILQNFFGTGTEEMQTPSDLASEINKNVQEAEAIGLLRRHKLPGEEDSQVDKLLKDMKAKWHFVMGADLLNVLLLAFFLGTIDFFKRVTSEK